MGITAGKNFPTVLHSITMSVCGKKLDPWQSDSTNFLNLEIWCGQGFEPTNAKHDSVISPWALTMARKNYCPRGPDDEHTTRKSTHPRGFSVKFWAWQGLQLQKCRCTYLVLSNVRIFIFFCKAEFRSGISVTWKRFWLIRVRNLEVGEGFAPPYALLQSAA